MEQITHDVQHYLIIVIIVVICIFAVISAGLLWNIFQVRLLGITSAGETPPLASGWRTAPINDIQARLGLCDYFAQALRSVRLLLWWFLRGCCADLLYGAAAAAASSRR